MPLPSSEFLRRRLTPPAGPCVSVYLPTHRTHPDNRRDPIAFKNLVATVEASLRQQHPGREVRPVLAPFQALHDDARFWQHTLDGLAVLAADGLFDVVKLHRPVPELAVVADSFHLKPLLRAVQSADRFHVLGVSRDRAWLWDGDRYGLDPVDLSGFPESLTDALAGGPTGPSPAADPNAGLRADALALGNDPDAFFRLLDRELLARVSKADRLPVVLAGLTDNTAAFRKLATNPHILPGGVTGDPGSFTAEALRAAAWQAVLPQYEARLARLTDEFHAARSKQLASADLSDIGRAVAGGRVATLLVDADKVVPGRLAADGAIASADLSNPRVDDLLDELAERALATGAEVVVVPADRMPADTGAAAVFRF